MLLIRVEEPSDAEEVFQVERIAFGRTNEAELVDRLRRSARPQLSLVATLRDELVGHVFFSPVRLEASPDLAAAALGPLAVAPRHQRTGIGSALVRAGLSECPGHGWRAVFLVGDPRYYRRFGFEPAAPRGLVYGVASMEPAFQLVELDGGALDHCRGRVHFDPAFADAEGG